MSPRETIRPVLRARYSRGGEFAAAKIYHFSCAFDGTAGGVDFEIADVQDRGSRFIFPADHGANAGEQLGEDKGFDEVVIRALFEADDAILRGVLGGEEEDHGSGALLAELAQDGEAVNFGQHDVQDDDVVLAIAGVPECGLSVGGFIDCETGFAQALNERFAKGLEIFNNEESHMANIITRKINCK